jgi:hypothetical protein
MNQVRLARPSSPSSKCPTVATISGMAWIPISVVLVIVATALWVYADARTQSQRGNPVVCSIGVLEGNSPTTWFIACLILWILFFPTYVVVRGQGGRWAKRHDGPSP